MSTGSTDAAILMTLLDDDQAAQIVGELSPSEIEALGSAMIDLSSVAPAQARIALDRFVGAARSAAPIAHDGRARAQMLLGRALGDERGAALMAKLAPVVAARRIDALRWMAIDVIAAFVADEHPQVGAVVLADLDPERAAALLVALPVAMQDDLVARVSKLGAIAPVALEAVAAALVAAADAPLPEAKSEAPQVTALAAIVSRMPRPADQTLLRALGKRDKRLAQSIADEMFVFADIPELPSRDLSAVVRAIDADILKIALKSLGSEQREAMLAGLSQRAAQTIRDDLDECGPLPLADVQDAQKQVVAVARRLESEGVLQPRGNTGAYV